MRGRTRIGLRRQNGARFVAKAPRFQQATGLADPERNRVKRPGAGIHQKAAVEDEKTQARGSIRACTRIRAPGSCSIRSRSTRASALAAIHRHARASLKSEGRSRRGQQAGNFAGIDPCQAASHGRLNHRALVDPGDPRFIDNPGVRPDERAEVGADLDLPKRSSCADHDHQLLLGVNGHRKRHMKPRDSGRQHRRMPGHRIVHAPDHDLVGKPRGAQIDFELGHRPVMDSPVQLTLEAGRRAGDEKLASNFARRVRPGLAKNKLGNRSRRSRLEFKPINRTGIARRWKDTPTGFFPALFQDMKLIEEHSRGSHLSKSH